MSTEEATSKAIEKLDCKIQAFKDLQGFWHKNGGNSSCDMTIPYVEGLRGILVDFLSRVKDVNDFKDGQTFITYMLMSLGGHKTLGYHGDDKFSGITTKVLIPLFNVLIKEDAHF